VAAERVMAATLAAVSGGVTWFFGRGRSVSWRRLAYTCLFDRLRAKAVLVKDSLHPR